MHIFVKAKPDGYEDKVEKIDDAHFVVETREPPIRGRANQSIIRLLAGYFKIPAFKIRLIKGARERSKIFEINESR
jgi:hypothetical protein